MTTLYKKQSHPGIIPNFQAEPLLGHREVTVVKCSESIGNGIVILLMNIFMLFMLITYY